MRVIRGRDQCACWDSLHCLRHRLRHRHRRRRLCLCRRRLQVGAVICFRYIQIDWMNLQHISVSKRCSFFGLAASASAPLMLALHTPHRLYTPCMHRRSLPDALTPHSTPSVHPLYTQEKPTRCSTASPHTAPPSPSVGRPMGREPAWPHTHCPAHWPRPTCRGSASQRPAAG